MNYDKYMKNISICLLIVFLVSSLINTTSAVSSTSTFDEDNKTLIIKKPASNIGIYTTNNAPSANDLLMTVQQVSVKPDLVTMEEIFKITSYERYTFTQNNDFNILWQKFKGQNDIINAKWEILETVQSEVTVPDFELIEKSLEISNIESYTDVTDIYDSNPWKLDWGVNSKQKWDIISANGKATIGFAHYEITSTNPLNIKFFWYENEQTSSHQEIRNHDVWKPFLPDGRTIEKDETYFIKLTFYKQAETGAFSIRTIPRFAGIDEDRLTWWNASWNYRIDNTIANGERPYQLSLILSNSTGQNNATHVFLNGHSNINFTDIRFMLDNTTALSYWIEKTTGKVWVNVTANGIVNLYYGNPSAVDASDGKKTFEFFDDFEPQSWQKIKTLPEPRSDQAGAVLDGKIYTIGGYDTSFRVPETSVWAYDPVANSYQPRANLKYARWGLACTGHNSNIYCFGGLNGNTLPQRGDRPAEKYDPGNNTWVTLSIPPLPLQNQGLSAVSNETYIYLFRNGSLYQYDPIDDSYILLNNTPPQNVESWPAMVFYQNEIYIMGGHYNSAGRNYVQIYNITNNVWRTGTPMPIGLYGTLRENPVINDKIYILQGQGITRRADFFSRYWVYNISSDKWNWGELGYWDADGVSGGVIGNKIYTFGGRRDTDSNDTGTDFAGVLDTTKNIGAEWLDVQQGSWRVDNSSLTNGCCQYYPTVQIRTAEKVVQTNRKVISKMKYSGSSGFGGLITHSNGKDYNTNTTKGYLDPLINITANKDLLINVTGPSFDILGNRSLASPDVWHTYISSFGPSSIISTRDGKDDISVTDGTYRGGYIQVIKSKNFKLFVDYIAVARYVTLEPVWSSWSEGSSNIVKPNIISWNNDKTGGSLALIINTNESVRFNATADQTITEWNWVKDGVNQVNNFDNFTASWSLEGNQSIKVNATNSNGTSNNITWNVTVNAPSGLPKPVITAWNNKTNNSNLALTINTSENVKFNATADQTITAWNWTKDGVNQDNNFDNFTASWSLAGTQSIKVNATNSNGTSNTITWNVTVNGPSPLTITITSPEDKSINNTGFINVTVTLNRTGTAFLNWEGSNESLGEGKTFYKNKIGLLSGNYSFRVYANDSAGISNVSQIRTITVNRSITKTLDINQSTGNLSKDEFIISPSGNVTVTIFNGTNATINSTRITNITIDSPRTVPYSLTDSNDRFIGENLTLGPDGAVFNPAIRLNFSYNDSQLGTIPASRLKIKFYNNTTSRWDELTTTINQTGRIATATTTHFSTFALMGTPEPAPNLPSTSSGGGGGGGSSGGGGGGGGSSGENYTNIEVIEKYDMQISKDALTSYRFTHAKNPIMFVNITGNTSLGIFTASIEALKGTSTLVKVSPEGLIYKNVNIWIGTSGFATPKNIKEALIKFRIDNAWMSANGVLASDIVLMKWDGKSWINLETKLLSKDDTNSYFEGKTNAFSPFVITQLKKSVPPAMPQATAQSGIPANVTATIPGEKTSEGAQPINFSIIIAMFVIIGIVTLVYIKRREIFKK